MVDKDAIYRLYRDTPDEGRSSYLYRSYHQGLIGMAAPGRAYEAQYAAWRAGRDTAKATAVQEGQ